MEPHVITRCSDCGIANRRAGSDKILRLRFVHTIFALYKFVCMYVYVVPVRNFFSLLNLISVSVCDFDLGPRRRRLNSSHLVGKIPRNTVIL